MTGSYLTELGIDYGLGCVSRMINACNGDNRDASYLNSYPLVELDKNSKAGEET